MVTALFLEAVCKGLGAIVSQTSHHNANHGQVDPGFFTAGEQFVVLGQAAPGGEPSKRSLHHPSTRKDMEAFGADLLPVHFRPFRGPGSSQATPGMLDNLDLPAQCRLDPLNKAAFAVAAIGPDQLEPRQTCSQRPEQIFATIVILQTRLMHQQVDKQAVGIYQDMALTAFDLLAAIVAAPPPFGSFSRIGYR